VDGAGRRVGSRLRRIRISALGGNYSYLSVLLEAIYRDPPKNRGKERVGCGCIVGKPIAVWILIFFVDARVASRSGMDGHRGSRRFACRYMASSATAAASE
jgi:hypothetical protein